MAILEGDKPIIIPNNLGDRLTPSVVLFTEDNEIIVGKKARRGAILSPDRTVFSIKRHMGTNFRVKIGGKEYTPQELSAMIIQKLKQDLENYLGEEVEQAVITVPAYFNDAQRQATRDAGEIAGLNVRRIIDEPTAAAISYGFDKEEDQILMVYDLGGGTFDVSIIEIISGVFQVLAIKGNNMLGGDDFDNLIVEYLMQEFQSKEGIDLSGDRVARMKLREAAEEAKIELSDVHKTNVLVEAVTMTQQGPVTLDIELTRAKLESMIGELVESTVRPTRQAIEDAGLTPDDVNNVVLVGGSTRIPLVQRTVRETIGREPRKDVNPDECVALGAAIQSMILASLDKELQDTAADRTGTEGPVIVHLTPFSLGVGLVNDQYGVIIEKNATYPTEAKDQFTTTRDFQTAISFPVYEGEEAVASANTFLDMLLIDGIPPAPRGVPKIEVLFRLNQDRILEATARDVSTGIEVSITIVATDNRLTPEEKARMTREARTRVTSMLEQRMKETIFNQAEGLIYRAEEMVESYDDPLADEARAMIEELRSAMKVQDHNRVTNKVHELDSLLQRLETADY
jgi:molecular chaperone DnaK